MQINVRHVGQGSVVQPVGDVDMASSPQLRETILGLLQERSGIKIVVNMEKVDYIDSSGIASLVEGLKLARRRKAKLCLAGLKERPLYVLQLTRLLDVFEVHSSESEALSA